MGNIASQPVVYMPANRFRVSVDGETYGEFAEVDGLDDFDFGVLEIHTGDSNVVASQSAGKKVSAVLKFTKGAVPAGNERLRQWCDLVVDPSGQNGAVDPLYKKNVLIEQLDRSGSPVDALTC
jgi:T4-like virus tail tube protein gp19